MVSESNVDVFYEEQAVTVADGANETVTFEIPTRLDIVSSWVVPRSQPGSPFDFRPGTIAPTGDFGATWTYQTDDTVDCTVFNELGSTETFNARVLYIQE